MKHSIFYYLYAVFYLILTRPSLTYVHLSLGKHSRFFNGHPIRKDFVGWSGIGPISYLLEYAIGLKPDAANNTLAWNLRSNKPVGCRNYRFGGHTVHLTAKENAIEIDSDGEFTLSIQTSQRTVEKKIVKGHQSIEMP